MIPVIYVITNNANGKKYVGCTGRAARFRFEEHMKCLRGHLHKNKEMQEDYDLYGPEVFTYEVVDQKLHLHQESEERAWMIKLKTYDERYGYNNKDPMMNRIRREHGLSYEKGHNPSGWAGEWWKRRSQTTSAYRWKN